MASSDIVERLKSAAKPLQHMGNEEEALAAAAIEAANEIEKLRGFESNWAGCADTCARLHKEIEKLRVELQNSQNKLKASGRAKLREENEKLRAENAKLKADLAWFNNPDAYSCADDDQYAEPPAPATCPHGNPIGYCYVCDVASDHAYDAAREDRMFRR